MVVWPGLAQPPRAIPYLATTVRPHWEGILAYFTPGLNIRRD
jgi:hypothetical protein